MTPIQEILNRIRWDPGFGEAEFVIGYRDRFRREIVLVPFCDLTFDPEDHFDVEVTDPEEGAHRVPLHRIRVVYRNGVVIWERPEGFDRRLGS